MKADRPPCAHVSGSDAWAGGANAVFSVSAIPPHCVRELYFEHIFVALYKTSSENAFSNSLATRRGMANAATRLNLLSLKNHCRAIFAALQRNPNGAAPPRQLWPPALPTRTAGRLLLLSRPASLLPIPSFQKCNEERLSPSPGTGVRAPPAAALAAGTADPHSRAAPAPEPSGVAPPIPSFQKRNKERLSPSPGTGVRRSPAAALSAGTAGPHSRAAPAPEPSGVAPPYPSLPKTQQRTPVPFSWDRRSRSPAAALAAGTAGPRQLCQPALPASPTYSSSVMSWLRICVAAVTPT